ncbi:hypothetical protein BC332_11013 [Capsicum chinense]|nr:hypothetical protein BC332_11013 [Capsicum chinense]
MSPDDLWGIWMSLFATGAFGLWSEKTKIGSMVSAALISTLVGLTGSNMGIIPYEAPAYSVVLKYPLPLTIPLLLFRENLRHVLHSTGPLLLAFLLASAGMIIGSVVAYLMVTMRLLGQDSWKIAAALIGRYIGGTINYVAICDALGVSPSVMAAGVAADNVICAIYFIALFSLASKIMSEVSTSSGGPCYEEKSKVKPQLEVELERIKASTLRRRLEFPKPGGSVEEYPRQHRINDIVEVTHRVMRGQTHQDSRSAVAWKRIKSARISPQHTHLPDNDDDNDDETEINSTP